MGQISLLSPLALVLGLERLLWRCYFRREKLAASGAVLSRDLEAIFDYMQQAPALGQGKGANG